jgi:hypothetical protein
MKSGYSRKRVVSQVSSLSRSKSSLWVGQSAHSTLDVSHAPIPVSRIPKSSRRTNENLKGRKNVKTQPN